LIVTVFFGLPPFTSRPYALAAFSLEPIGSEEKTEAIINDHK